MGDYDRHKGVQMQHVCTLIESGVPMKQLAAASKDANSMNYRLLRRRLDNVRHVSKHMHTLHLIITYAYILTAVNGRLQHDRVRLSQA
jgi:hypothetical protein